MFAKWHRTFTTLCAGVATLCVAAIALAYCGEVVARYFFGTPLNWSGDISSYLLLACVFLALPKVTAAAAHVAVSAVSDRLGANTRKRYERALSLIAGICCLATAYFIAGEGLRQYNEQVLTSQATQIPKWLLSAVAFTGFLSAALHFILPRRHSEQGEAAQDAGA